MYLVNGFPRDTDHNNEEATASAGSDGRARRGPDLSEAAATLGVTEDELFDALGGFPLRPYT